jgi:hypothetical protein
MHILAKVGLGVVGAAAVVAGGSYAIVKIEEHRVRKQLVNRLSKSPTFGQVYPALAAQGEVVQRALGVDVVPVESQSQQAS